MREVITCYFHQEMYFKDKLIHTQKLSPTSYDAGPTNI